jgi:palmitoyl-protein thioesterase
VLIELVLCVTATFRPVALMHGLDASSESMNGVETWVKADFPGIYTKNIEVGNGKEDSWFMPINQQVEAFAKAVQSDPNLTKGFNLICHSQGGMLARAYVERYNNPPVYNLITWSSPHAGVYGVPDFNAICPDQDCPWLNEIMSALMEGKAEFLQDHIAFAAYWRDPMNVTEFKAHNRFLTDINNMRESKNATYKAHLSSLNTFLMMFTTQDAIVIPKQSPQFAFYADGSMSKLVPLKQTDTYTGDWIGLQTLDKAGKLLLHQCNCSHQDYPRPDCKWAYDLYTKPLLNNTLS